jgi:hypothetical protein
MLTFHQSFSTRIFLNGGPGSREAEGSHCGFAVAQPSKERKRLTWGRDLQSRLVIAAKPSRDATGRSNTNLQGGAHAH